jgi:hypothetical protein
MATKKKASSLKVSTSAHGSPVQTGPAAAKGAAAQRTLGYGEQKKARGTSKQSPAAVAKSANDSLSAMRNELARQAGVSVTKSASKQAKAKKVESQLDSAMRRGLSPAEAFPAKRKSVLVKGGGYKRAAEHHAANAQKKHEGAPGYYADEMRKQSSSAAAHASAMHTAAKSVKQAGHKVLQHGKKGGTFYLSEGKKHYVKK